MPNSTTPLIPKNLNSILITNRKNIGYLSNFWGSFGCLLITSKKHILFTDSRYTAEAQKTVFPNIKVEPYSNLEKHLNSKLKIGYESNDVTVSELKRWQKKFPLVSLRQTQNRIEQIRINKTPDELKYIQKAAQINDKILITLKSEIQIGITEKELKHKIISLGLEFGAEKMAFNPIVSFGKNTSKPHHEPDGSKLKKGEIILIDIGVKFQKYCSDITRIFFTQPPTSEQLKIFKIVQEAQNKAKIAVKKGKCNQIDQAARDYINQNGFGDYFGHSTGHGVGLEIHESPSLSSLNEEKIPNHSVFTIEPGIYLPGKFGIRLEDLFYYQENKLKQISRFTKNIEELTLKL